LIVIDSGSSEDERSVCRDLKDNFMCLVYERTEKETLYAAWNRALAKASGKYFMNANTDDALHPCAIQMLTDALESRPDASIAYGDWMWATVPNATYPWDPSFRRCAHPGYHPSLPLFYAYAGCHQFWRTEKLRELGGFDAEYKAAGDYDALCRLALKRGKAVYVPEAVSAFYQNPDGLSRSSDVSYREFLEIRDRFRSTFSIEDLYDVDSADRRACAAAWVDLGHRALKLRVPWAEENTPDMQFAEVCARRALGLEPANADAARMLQRAAPASTGFWSSLRKMIAPTGAAVSGRS
jgi:glycosyltransferase involved in cell wall biosynthesis